MTIICAHCHQRQPHEARGMCKRCYAFVRARGLLSVFPQGRRAPAAKDRTAYYAARYQARKEAGHASSVPPPPAQA